VRGIGTEYHATGLNPAFSQERFQEAHDLIVAAWTRPGPFEFEGEHYNFRYVNLWPRPYQSPHPPIWIPSQGSSETIRWAMLQFSVLPDELTRRNMEMFAAEVMPHLRRG
jgi:alkanesulfonate monooxygenase SsuD/methylene tetrahydromethanopterin reductase-like flavin-dependent oxidoreductase (luciferase family)